MLLKGLLHFIGNVTLLFCDSSFTVVEFCFGQREFYVRISLFKLFKVENFIKMVTELFPFYVVFLVGTFIVIQDELELGLRKGNLSHT